MPSNSREYANKWCNKNKKRVYFYNVKYRAKHKKHYQEYNKKYYQKNKNKLKIQMKGWWLKTYYKISFVEFMDLKKKQDYKCKICNKRKPLCVDHNHITGKVRGLVCKNCNWLIGRVEHNMDKVLKISRYVNTQRS